MAIYHPDDFMDVAAERAVLAGIFKYGSDAYVDVDDLIGGSPAFRNPTNQVIYNCIRHIYNGSLDKNIDIPTLQAAARDLKLSVFDTPDQIKHLGAIQNYPVAKESVREQAARIRKLHIANNLDTVVASTREKLRQLTGAESLNDILGVVEHPVTDYVSNLNEEGDGPVTVGQGAREWLDHILEHPCENIGIPTPFPIFNGVLGGGFRRSGISIVGARAKQGKTMLSDVIGLHVTGNLGIPVLNLDTEMTHHEHLSRIFANRTGIPISDIERGQVNSKQKKALRECAEWLKTIPYHYESVIDKSFEEQLSIIRRWVRKNVPLDQHGVRGDCLIIYDYLQLTDAREFGNGNFREYQILGFQMLSLLRMAARLDIPIFSLLQLNREGIEKETAAAAAGSDRIIWKCANFSILKRKSEDEIAQDGVEEGSHKLIPIVMRHGEDMAPGDYINLKFTSKTGTMEEGKTRYQLEKERRALAPQGFEVEGDGTELSFAEPAL